MSVLRQIFYVNTEHVKNLRINLNVYCLDFWKVYFPIF